VKGISSVYGFILIFLLSMASIQTWSSAVGAMESIQAASDQGHELQQLQGIERLSLSLSNGSLTISNDGQVPSTVEFARLLGANSSRTLALDLPVPVGDSVVEHVPPGYGVEVVTSLGNVFVAGPAAGPPGSIWSAPSAAGAARSEQLFQNPYDPSSFYLGSGPWVYAFSSSGVPEWSFDAGAGVVTDVMPISSGPVYVSVGYAAPSNAGELFELDPSGRVMASFSVRVLDTPDSSSSLDTLAVAKGETAGYVYYDGWFYSTDGNFTSLPVSGTQLAGTDPSSFYLYTWLGGSSYGNCQPWGNEMVLESFAPGAGYPGGLRLSWTAFAYVGPCTRYDPQLLGASTGGGVLATLFAAPYYSDSYLQGLPGHDPYIAVISASGQVLYDHEAPSNGYTAVATDGSRVFLAMPELDQVQVLSLSSQTVATYDIGIPASALVCDHGLLFAVSPSEVKVYDGAMNLVRTIDLAPLALASYTNAFPFEPALQAPSFLVLNGTSYAALAENATGFTSLAIGRYA